MRVSRFLLLIAAVTTTWLGLTGSPLYAQEQSRTREQVEAAKKLDPDVTASKDRTEFLKKYPRTELQTNDRETGFSEYMLVAPDLSKNFYVFWMTTWWRTSDTTSAASH